MSKQKRVRVGNAGGYWGDDLGTMKRQLEAGALDYLTQDFLAEITMSILRKQRNRNPDLGYAVDFIQQFTESLPVLKSGATRIITNAGGINPGGCADQIARIAAAHSADFKIATVEGDDLMDRLDELVAAGHQLNNMETGEPITRIRERVESANVYLGAAPVISALEMGARIVITGRVTDTGITAAPPVFEFDWALDDWDKLASAVVAGHILECGAQATGGNLTDWDQVPSLEDIGYPIAEFRRDGSFLITKAEGTGGKVDRVSVTSQLIYEMGDPKEYITPDVVADFSSIRLEDAGSNQVEISGVTGRRRTDQLKVSVSYHDGFKAHGTMIVSGPQAVDKCRRMAEIFWRRLDLDLEETSSELVGFDSCHRHLSPTTEPPEILLRLGARDSERDKIAEFSKLFTSLILNTVSGVAIVGARPRIQDVIAYWPCLIPADEITPTVTLRGGGKPVPVSWIPVAAAESETVHAPRQEEATEEPAGPYATRWVALSRLCYGRSGDKGDTANIGIVARQPEIFDWLRRHLTADRVKENFADLCAGPVERFEIPNLNALNFLLHQALGGGGTVSLRVDPQGKTLADALLRMEVEVPEELLASLESVSSAEGS